MAKCPLCAQQDVIPERKKRRESECRGRERRREKERRCKMIVESKITHREEEREKKKILKRKKNQINPYLHPILHHCATLAVVK